MTGKVYFGFALADSMFAGNCNIRRSVLTAEQVKRDVELGIVEACLNPSHEATIKAMRSRFGIDIAIPPAPPRVLVGPGDAVIVMGVRGLPRLTDRHEYTDTEIAQATFEFAEYSVGF